MTDSRPCISIIIPVYSGKDYFSVLLSQLRKQTLKNIEFIIIDDCGTDGTFDLAKEAAKEDSRFILLQNEKNMGPGPSRNKGILEATGEYIAFIDSDDVLPIDYYERLYTRANETGAKVVKSGLLTKNSTGEYEHDSLNKLIRQELSSGIPLVCLFTYQFTTAIYSREHILNNKAFFAESRYAEDLAFLMQALHNIEPRQYEQVDDVYYYYVQHSTSLMHSLDAAYYTEGIISLKNMVSYMLRYGNHHVWQKYAPIRFEAFLRFHYQHAQFSEYITYTDKKNYIRDVVAEIRRYMSIQPNTHLKEQSAKLFTNEITIDEFIQESSLQNQSSDEKLKRIISLLAKQNKLERDYRKIRLKLLCSVGKNRKKHQQKKAMIKKQLREIKDLGSNL